MKLIKTSLVNKLKNFIEKLSLIKLKKKNALRRKSNTARGVVKLKIYLIPMELVICS